MKLTIAAGVEQVDSTTDRAFYIAQMVAKGSSLADLIQNGWHATEGEVKRIAIEVSSYNFNKWPGNS